MNCFSVSLRWEGSAGRLSALNAAATWAIWRAGGLSFVAAA